MLDVCGVHQYKGQNWTWHYIFQNVEWKHFQHIHNRLALSSIQQGCALPPCHKELSLWYHMLFFCMNISASVSKTVMYARPLSNSYTFLTPLHAVNLPRFGQNLKPDPASFRILVWSWRIPEIVILLRYLQPAETYKWKEKNIMFGSTADLKKFTIINSSSCSDNCFTQCGTGWGYTFISVSGQFRMTAKECLKPSISRHLIFKSCFPLLYS